MPSTKRARAVRTPTRTPRPNGPSSGRAYAGTSVPIAAMIASVSSGRAGRRAAASDGGSSADICPKTTDSRADSRPPLATARTTTHEAPRPPWPRRARGRQLPGAAGASPRSRPGTNQATPEREGDAMSTGLIIAIVVIVALIILLFAVVMPRARAKAREREMERRRGEVAGAHRERAEDRAARAEIAEHEARRERAEAELHESRARLHERGLADDELHADRERFASDRDDDVAGRDRLADERDATVPPEERR